MARILSDRDKQLKKEWAIRNAELTKQRNKERYEIKRKEILQKCKEYRESKREEISARRKLTYQQCKEELSLKRKAHYEANKSAYSERAKKSYIRRKELCLEANRRNLQKQKDLIASFSEDERRVFLAQRREKEQAYREENRDRVRQSKKKYIERNPHKILEKDARRRQRLSVDVTPKEKEAVRALLLKWKKKAHHYCTYCDAEIRGNDCCVDHILPVALGGRHVVSNLCLACRSCNSRKGAKILGETWFPPRDKKS